MSSLPVNVAESLPPPVTPAELAPAEEGAVVAALPGTVVRATGEDAASFLHGQLANDVSGLAQGAVNHSLALNHKGHAMAEASVARRGKNDFLLVIDDDGADWLLPSLDSHIIFDQVRLETEPGRGILTLQGAGAAALLPQAPAAGAFLELSVAGADLVAFARRRSLAGGFDLVVNTDDVPRVVEALVAAGAAEVRPEVITALRVKGLVPAARAEGGEGVLPQEVALEHALSYRKGCYLGQEIMARIEARGNMRRSLARVSLDGLPGAERRLRLEGRVVGLLGSVIRTAAAEGEGGTLEALAVLRNDLPEDAVLEAGAAIARRL